MKKVKRPNPWGHPHYPAYDFHISHGALQIYPIRGNAAIYGKKIEDFKRWMDRVKKYADYELARHLK